MKIFQETVNMSVVQVSQDDAPGVLLKGESLAELYADALDVLEKLDGVVKREEFLLALSHAEVIEIYINNYEKAMKENGMKLPYERCQNRSTNKYQKYWDNDNI